MKNTLENRLKFYAQHLGQNIIIDSDCFSSENSNDIIHTTLVSVTLKGIECDGWIPVTEHTSLEFKPLSAITDEDALELATLMNPPFGFSANSTVIKTKLKTTVINGNHSLDIGFKVDTLSKGFILKYENKPQSMFANEGIIFCDFLRSKGYALPWMGLSVENLVEYGWIKIKDHV